MNAFRPFIDPFEGLRSGEISYTTAIVRPKMPHEKRRAIAEKAEKMGLILYLLAGAIIAALFHLKLVYTLFFCAFIICIFSYMIIATILNAKAEAYETTGLVLWQKDCFILTEKQENPTRIIPYTSVRSAWHKEGIPHQAFNKSKSRDRDFTSIIIELVLEDQSTLTVEMLYTSSYQCTDPYQSLRIKPLTEQLLKFVFSEYIILDKRALDRSGL